MRRTFKEPPAQWRPSRRFGRTISPARTESLVGDLIRAGVTGAPGNVNEPYLDASIRPDILFPAYVSGRNLAESFYAAMPYLSWQTIIVGDPLCAPFPRADRRTRGSRSADRHRSTELPAYFAERQLATMYPELRATAAAAFIRFQYRTPAKRPTQGRARRSRRRSRPSRVHSGARRARRDARACGRWDRAIAQYRAILQYSPNDPLALNNLAYALATHQQSLEEALSFAERAITAARTDPSLLWWHEHHELLHAGKLPSRAARFRIVSTRSRGCSICSAATPKPRARSSRRVPPAGCKPPT